MKTKLLLTLLIFAFWSYIGTAQVPQGINYQAVARDAAGTPLANLSLAVKIGIQTTQAGGTLIWEEQQTITTNQYGSFSLVVGTGTKTGGTAATFNNIVWNGQTLYLKTTVQYPGTTWTAMGAAQVWSVPYSLVADKANGLNAGARISVTSKNDAGTEALFEVKRQDGQTVFAVYPDAVNIYVPRSATGKGAKGGFAIGGFDGSKTNPQDYFRVTPDSVRVYIDPTPTVKGSKGGFAIGGYGENKGGFNNMYFNLSGATAVNTVPESPQILWYPIKKAFFAGSVHIGSVDSVGQNSTALGYRSIAMGNYSQAFGYKAKAFGDYSTSIGKNSVAGSRTAPLSNSSFAFGDAAKALGDNSIAFGKGAQATGTNSVSIGVNSLASGTTSISFGSGSQATNTNSMAIGNGTIASGTNSTALGYQSQAQSDKSIAIGSYYSTSYLIPIISIGKGGSQGDSKGEVFLPVRPVTLATTLTKTFNRANIAQGQYSVVVGNGNLAQNGGFVFGSNSDALQFGAMALGTSAGANNKNSISIGYESNANGIYSVAIGNNVTANSYGEFALGQFAEDVTGTADTWNENEQLFTIGNGTSTTDRSNALTIYKNGKTVVRGRYAFSTFNYQTTRLTLITFPTVHFVSKDYVYGIYTNLNRDDPAIEYYYSGYFGSTGTEGTYYGLYADYRSGASIDVAEYIYDTKANTEPADVVIADALNKESVVKSSKPYQNSVVGVISTKPSMTMGMELVADEKTGKPLANPKPSARLALTGRVPVKVCGENGNIIPGDYLTTSSTPGTAMKWSLLDVNAAKDFEDLKKILSENERRRNAIIGKAVEGFTGTGTGKIVVLISLQ